jgi:hypothetical protein
VGRSLASFVWTQGRRKRNFMEETRKKSLFVTVIALINIVFFGFSAFLALNANNIHYSRWLPTPLINYLSWLTEIGSLVVMVAFSSFFSSSIGFNVWGGVPVNYENRMVYSYFSIFFVGIISVFLIVISIGLLKRKKWARFLYIRFLWLLILWSLLGVFYQFFSMFLVPPKYRDPRIINEIGVLAFVFLEKSAVCLFCGALIKKFVSPGIKQEFTAVRI